ncbi:MULTISPECIES: hypothetical protein [Clostridium]|uniref:hypothetical protein n=1 Tax=Clostridium TaxID=1485 RepID=UPI000825994F|nr:MULTISPECIES: hypothetical protein [Clostridium]PJI09589.1 hypothetical protein CUB90_17705 [Clostridium sp. CT7]
MDDDKDALTQKNSIIDKVNKASDTIFNAEYEKLIVNVLTVNAPNSPILTIDSTKNTVKITNSKIQSPIRKVNDKWEGSIILNGYVENTVIYKTVSNIISNTISGNIQFLTTRIDFEINAVASSITKFSPKSKLDVVSAYIENERKNLIEPNPVLPNHPVWALTYNKLLEKILIKVQIKIINKAK